MGQDSVPQVPVEAPEQTQPTAPTPQATGVPIYNISGQEPVLGNIDPSEVTESVASGSFSFPKGVPVHVISPEGTMGTMDPAEAPEAFKNGYKYATPDEVQYGGYKGEAQAFTEGAVKGLLGPLAAPLESAYGVDRQQLLGHQQINPTSSGVGEAGGFLAGAGLGQAAALSKAGEAAEVVSGLGQGGKLSQIGAEGLNQAVQGILMQGGEELHKAYVQDPSQTADSVIMHMTMAPVLAGLFGGATGALLRKATPEAGQFISELDKAALDKGALKQSIEASDVGPTLKERAIKALDLGRRSSDAGELEKASETLGVPLPEGALNDHEAVQRARDILNKGRYTVAGDAYGKQLDKAYSGAQNVLESAAQSTNNLSKEELGHSLVDSLTKQTEEAYQPIKKIYSDLESMHSAVPVDDVVSKLKASLANTDVMNLEGRTEAGKMARNVLETAQGVKTADDLSKLKSLPELRDLGTATNIDPMSRIKSIIRDKIEQLQQEAVEKASKSSPELANAVGLAKEAKTAYKPYIQKLSEFSNWIGKGRIHGTEDALRFINEKLSPTELSSRIFSASKDPQFVRFMQKEFPSQYEAMRQFKRAEVLDASRSIDHGFVPKTFFRKFNDLETEIQKALYSPEEVAKIKASETFLGKAFPRTYNGSDTAHTLMAHEALGSIHGYAVANARDAALKKAISVASKTAEGRQAIELAQATVKGEKATNNAIKGIFNATKQMPANVIPIISARAKMDKLVQEAIKDPNKLVAMNDNNNSIPAYSATMAASAARVVTYLSSIKPDQSPKSVLDSKLPPDPNKKAMYDRALDIANQPLVVLNGLKDARITPFDIMSLRSMYPNVYNKLSTKINQEIVESVHEGKEIPYKTRMGLSIFLGQPLDSTMTPEAIISAQPKPVPQDQSQRQPAGKPPSESSMKGIDKLPNQYRTPGEARAVRAQRTK